MTLPIERFKEAYKNWRWNPFTSADMAVDATEDGLIIPSGSPFLIQLLEVPRYNDPTTVSVRCYGVKTDVDQDSASGQLILYVASTVGFSPADKIIINRGGAREEERIINTVQAGISLTVTVNLTYTHTAVQEDDVEKYIAFTETAGAPAQSQFRVDYPPADGEGTGLVEFNQNDADKEVRINYKATGSPILEEYLDTKLSYPAGAPADNQIVGFASGVPYWLQLPHANLAGIGANDHHAQSHTLASHSTKPHSALTDVTANQHHAQTHTHASHTSIGPNDHHAQAHTLTSHSTRAHSELTGIWADDHHARLHAATHHSGAADQLAFASINGFSTYLDQAVKTTSTPSFAHLNLTNAASKLQGGTKLWLEAGGDGIGSVTIKDDTTAVAANLFISSAAVANIMRSTSSKRYKDKIKDLELDSSKIYNLRPVSFNSKSKNDDKNRRFIGLIAEEIEKEFPEIIQYNEKKEAESYDNQMLLTLVVRELQNLKKQIN